MKKTIPICLILCLVLTGCAASRTEEPTIDVSGSWESDPAYQEAMAWNEMAEEGIYLPDRDLGPYEVVEAFFEQHYKAYASNRNIDLSHILDMSQTANQNMEIWVQMLLQRRRLIAEHDLGYVETRQMPYSITFEDAPRDERMGFWNARGRSSEAETDEFVVHFVITGEAGHAYPPMMAMNAQHTMRLREIEGQWKITFHYFPGSVRKYYRIRDLTLPSDEACLEALLAEFAPAEPAAEPPPTTGRRAYDGGRAADYAAMYTEQGNPSFYRIGDWMGNCQNFISQAVNYGFLTEGESAAQAMTDNWFGGSGGGSPAWENVGYFWRFITGGQGMSGQPIAALGQLRAGDIIQTRTLGGERDSEDTGFSHALMVVDEDTLKLAQNSPACFVYYSDVFQVETRMIRPVGLSA